MQLKKFFLICCLVTTSYANKANLHSDVLIKVKNSKEVKVRCNPKLCQSPYTSKFYQLNDNNLVWINGKHLNSNAKDMIEIIKQSYEDGLNPKRYHLKHINWIIQNLDSDPDKEQRIKLLANLDVTLTDAFFLLANHLANGLVSKKETFPFWNVSSNVDLINVFIEAIRGDIKRVIDNRVMPSYSQYYKLKESLRLYQKIASKNPWAKISQGEALSYGNKGDRVKELRNRLIISGELRSGKSKEVFDKDLETAVAEFQRDNGLYDDGIVDESTRQILNIAISNRIKQIELNMDRIRYLPHDLGKEYIVVNLPEYSLSYYRNNKAILVMDVAVGDKAHPSCVLTGKINNLVLNPDWYVPANIAKEEVFPKLKEEGNEYLNRKKVKVFKKINNKYEQVNVDNINWNNVSDKEFSSYKFVQIPSDLNALGKVKFMFENPCMIYLHDTFESEIFSVYKRDFSHGCIRVGDPMSLMYYILKRQKDLSEKEVNKLLEENTNKVIALPEPINLYLIYLTAYVDEKDNLQFRPDIYNLDKLKKYPLYIPKEDEE